MMQVVYVDLVRDRCWLWRTERCPRVTYAVHPEFPQTLLHTMKKTWLRQGTRLQRWRFGMNREKFWGIILAQSCLASRLQQGQHGPVKATYGGAVSCIYESSIQSVDMVLLQYVDGVLVFLSAPLSYQRGTVEDLGS